MGLAQQIAQNEITMRYNKLPHSEKIKARDILIDIIKSNGGKIIIINDLQVDWGYPITHSKFKRKVTKRKITDINELNSSEKRQYDILIKRSEDKWISKAIGKYFLRKHKESGEFK